MLIRRIVNQELEIALWLRNGREDFQRSGVKAQISKRRASFITRRALEVWSLVDNTRLFKKCPALRHKVRVAQMVCCLDVVS
jgi:hypothetical protein